MRHKYYDTCVVVYRIDNATGEKERYSAYAESDSYKATNLVYELNKRSKGCHYESEGVESSCCDEEMQEWLENEINPIEE